MKVNINPTNIAEAVLLLHSEELLVDLADTAAVLAKSYELDDDKVSFYYFGDGSFISEFENDYQSHIGRK